MNEHKLLLKVQNDALLEASNEQMDELKANNIFIREQLRESIKSAKLLYDASTKCMDTIEGWADLLERNENMLEHLDD